MHATGAPTPQEKRPILFTTLFLTFATLAHALLLKVFVRDDECEFGAPNTLKRTLTVSGLTLVTG